MSSVVIDGAKHTGNYRCSCDCGALWHGQGEAINAFTWSPALPVAEAVAHFSQTHPRTRADVEFSARFREWLLQYWEQSAYRMHPPVKRDGFAAQIRMPS